MALIVALTSILRDGSHIFFYDLDHIELFDALEEANYLSQISQIDIDVNRSSPNCYHLLSFDVLSRAEVIEVQRNITLKTDHYLDLDEIALFRSNAEACRLRLGEKFKKDSPVFVKRFLDRHKRLKSLRHFRLAQFYYGTPLFRTAKFVDLGGNVCIYKTGIGSKLKEKRQCFKRYYRQISDRLDSRSPDTI